MKRAIKLRVRMVFKVFCAIFIVDDEMVDGFSDLMGSRLSAGGVFGR